METITKSESDGEHPASDCPHVGRPQHPTTWNLPAYDEAHRKAASAVFTGDYRGTGWAEVCGPDMKAAASDRSKLRKSRGLCEPWAGRRGCAC